MVKKAHFISLLEKPFTVLYFNIIYHLFYSSDHATESSDEDNNKKESEDDSSCTEYSKVNSSRKNKASQNEALDFNIYSAGSKNISNDIKKGTAIRNQLSKSFIVLFIIFYKYNIYL